MVDLVKIRKKAKKQDQDAEAAKAQARLAVEAESPKLQQPETRDAPKPPAAVESLPSPARLEPQLADAAGQAPVLDAGPSKLERFMIDAGKKRDAVAVASVAEESDGTILELLTFVIAGEQYAVDIDHIVEIVRPRPLTRIPNADESIVGIVSLRGTIVTLVDARRRLGHSGRAEETDDTRTVVVDREHETLGFTVDSVVRVVKIAADAVEPHPVVHSSEQHEAIRGVFRVANALTILLDLDKLLDHQALSAESEGRNSRLAQR